MGKMISAYFGVKYQMKDGIPEITEVDLKDIPESYDEFINNAFAENEFFSNLDEYGLDMNQITTELHPEVSEEIKKTQRENSLKLVENISETIVKKVFLK